MKKAPTLIAMVLAFALVAFAQSSYPGGQSTPPGQGSTTGQTGSMGQGSSTGQTGSMGQSADQNAPKARGEHKVKGCIRSEGGKYLLEDAHGRMFTLNTTEDLSAHVGHEVVVHGTESSAASSSTPTSTGNESMSGASTGKEITVSKIDMVSTTCKLGKHSKTTGENKGPASTKPSTSPQ